MSKVTRSKPKKFKDIVAEEFKKRKAQDPNYSIRKFSKSLEINDSSLSQILRGKRKVSPYTIQTAGRNLKMSNEEIAHFIVNEKEISIYEADYSEDEIFNNVSDWKFDVVIQLVAGTKGDVDYASLARKMNVSQQEVFEKVEFLLANGILYKKDLTWVANLENITSILSPEVTSESAKKYQINLMQRSISAIEKTDIRRRNHTSLVLNIDEEDFLQALEVIKRFRRKFGSDFHSKKSKKRKQVYALQIGFFPLTEDEI